METKYIEIDKDIRLAYIEKYNCDSKVGVILIHGLAEHKGRYEYFLKKVYDMKISVFAIDIRGHGESGGERGDIRDFNDYITDINCFVKKIRSEYKDLKFALLGHSLGGLIATGYVEEFECIDFLVLSSPLLTVPKIASLLKVIPYKLLNFIKIKKRHSESPEMLAYGYADPLASNYFSIRLLGMIFDQGISLVLSKLQNIQIPVLLLGGKLDPLIQTSNFNNILKKFGSKDKKLIIYDNVKHRLFQSEVKDDVIADMVLWINQRV